MSKNKTKPPQKGGNKDGPRKLSAEKRDENNARTRTKKARKHAERYAPKGGSLNKEPANSPVRKFRTMRMFHPQSQLGAMFPRGGVPVVNERNVPVRKNGKPVFKRVKGKKVKVTRRVVGKPTGKFHGPSLDLGGFLGEQQYAVRQLLQGITSEYIWVTPQSADWHTPIKESDKKLPHLREMLSGAWHVEAKFGEETEDGFVRLDESNYGDYARAVSYLLCSLRKEKRQQEIARKRIEVREKQEAEEARRKKRAAARRKQKWAKKQAKGWTPRRKSSETMTNRTPVNWK